MLHMAFLQSYFESASSQSRQDQTFHQDNKTLIIVFTLLKECAVKFFEVASPLLSTDKRFGNFVPGLTFLRSGPEVHVIVDCHLRGKIPQGIVGSLVLLIMQLERNSKTRTQKVVDVSFSPVPDYVESDPITVMH